MKTQSSKIDISIQQYVYNYIKTESRRRSLSEQDYLEVVIDMDRIQNSTEEEDEISMPEHLTACLFHEDDGRERNITISVPERHFLSLLRHARNFNYSIEKATEDIILSTTELLPLRKFTRKHLDAVIKAWDNCKG